MDETVMLNGRHMGFDWIWLGGKRRRWHCDQVIRVWDRSRIRPVLIKRHGDGDGLELPPDHTPKLMDQRGRDFNLSFCVFVFVMI